MVCGGQTSRLEVATELLKVLDLQNEVKITEVDSTFFAKEYFADRPPCERLVNKRLELRNLNIMQDWRIALVEYIKDYYKGYLD